MSAEICVDSDGDGYGANQSDRSNCPACKESRNRGCLRDCDDGNAKIHPGMSEVCNGADDDCDGQTDEPVICTGVSDCTVLEGSQDQENTHFDCKNVNGGKACVLVGANQQTTECQRIHTTCQMNGTYGNIPEKCRSF